jgi:hypothetical protein
MSNVREFAAPKHQWVRPEVRKISAGSAEANQPTGVDDGGPFGNARS